MKKQKKLLLIVISIILAMQLFIPILSFADGSTLTSSVTWDENNDKKINITASDTTNTIIAIKYVDKKISDHEYFLETHDDIRELTITPSKQISTSFEVSGYGDHTICIETEDSDHNLFLQLTQKHNANPACIPSIAIKLDQATYKTLTISITSPLELTELKIFKYESGDNINPDTPGTAIPFTRDANNNTLYTATYTVAEDGFYAIVAKNAEESNIFKIYCGPKFFFKEENIDPETREITDNSGKLKFSITTYAAPLSKVGIADKSLITNINDLEEIKQKVQYFQIASAPVTDVECPFEYAVDKNTTFVIYAEDTLKHTYTVSLPVVVEEDKPTMDLQVSQNGVNSTQYTITATNDKYNITEMKVKKGENVSEADLKANGESLTITPGKTVTAQYTITESCVLNIYLKDSNNNEQIIPVTINVQHIENPLKITSANVGTESEAIVNVTATDTTYDITTLKYAKGDYSGNYSTYFANNGTSLEITTGRTVNYTFRPTESGNYTFYAKDTNGNEYAHLITVTISQIDPPPADLSYEIIVPDEYTRDKATITLKITPAESAPTSIDFNGKTIVLTNGVGTFEVDKNGTYTMYFSSNNGDPIEKTFTVSKIYLLGDINNDTEVNSIDLLLLRRHIAALKSTTHTGWLLSGRALVSANINMDSNNEINLQDVLKLRRYLAATKNSSIADQHPDWLNL